VNTTTTLLGLRDTPPDRNHEASSRQPSSNRAADRFRVHSPCSCWFKRADSRRRGRGKGCAKCGPSSACVLPPFVLASYQLIILRGCSAPRKVHTYETRFSRTANLVHARSRFLSLARARALRLRALSVARSFSLPYPPPLSLEPRSVLISLLFVHIYH